MGSAPGADATTGLIDRRAMPGAGAGVTGGSAWGSCGAVEDTTTLSGTDDLEPWSTLEQLVRTLRLPAGDTDALVSRICDEACRIVPAARDVGVLVTDSDRNLRTVFATGAVPRVLDELQTRLGSGPCLTAARKQIVVRMHDIAADTRWPVFRAAALDCDVASMLCMPLYIDEELLGTLSFFGGRANAFREGAEPVARLVATVSAVALADSRNRARMERALRNRDLIGQAKGMLMHRHGVDADTAFALLRDRSQRTNSKLLSVAARVVAGGALD